MEDSARRFELGSFAAVVVGDLALLIFHRAFDGEDEIVATGGHAAHGDDGVALGVIIGHSEDFAEIFHAMGDAFDDVIGGVTVAGIDDFEFRRGRGRRRSGRRTCAIEDDGDGSANGVAIQGKAMDQFVARMGRVARLARSQFRPVVQQAIAIHESANQRHGGDGKGK